MPPAANPAETSRVRRSLRLPAPLQQRLRDTVVRLLARDEASQRSMAIDYDHPLGDEGLFGPRTLTWRVHADFPGMMAGGVCALMLQTLHPRALAGVWDHSNFRDDLLGRLRRTTAFVAGTSYAPRADAERLIALVRRLHERVEGVTADGQPYSANDPELLTWVHVTEMSSFLAGYERYRLAPRGQALSARERDRYFAETARLAEALGAQRVPRSAAGVAAYFRRVQPQLRYDERSYTVLQVLRRAALPVPGAAVFREVFVGAGAALLPDWAGALMGRGRVDRARADFAARSLTLAGPLLRAALADGVVARSHRRLGLQPPPI